MKRKAEAAKVTALAGAVGELWVAVIEGDKQLKRGNQLRQLRAA